MAAKNPDLPMTEGNEDKPSWLLVCAQDQTRTLGHTRRPIRCRVGPFLDQGGACGAAGPASAPGSGLGRPRPAHAGPLPQDTQIKMAHASSKPAQRTAVDITALRPASGTTFGHLLLGVGDGALEGLDV